MKGVGFVVGDLDVFLTRRDGAVSFSFFFSCRNKISVDQQLAL